VGDASVRPDPPSTWAEGALQVTRRSNTLVSPYGHPEPEQRRDLIGARLCVTRHSIVRSLPHFGWKLLATAKGADDVTMIGAERPDSTEVETILGVDTHLDFHVAVALDHLGRRLGELSVPTTVKGYERLLCWAEGLAPSSVPG
jgi:hypothetical protein